MYKIKIKNNKKLFKLNIPWNLKINKEQIKTINKIKELFIRYCDIWKKIPPPASFEKLKNNIFKKINKIRNIKVLFEILNF